MLLSYFSYKIIKPLKLKHLVLLCLTFSACTRKEAQKSPPKQREISSSQLEFSLEKAKTPTPEKNIRSIAPKAPIMPDKKLSYKAPIIPLGQKISTPANPKALNNAHNRNFSGYKVAGSNHLNRDITTLIKNPRPPIMPKRELDLPTSLAPPAPIPMPRICTGGKPCE